MRYKKPTNIFTPIASFYDNACAINLAGYGDSYLRHMWDGMFYRLDYGYRCPADSKAVFIFNIESC